MARSQGSSRVLSINNPSIEQPNAGATSPLHPRPPPISRWVLQPHLSLPRNVKLRYDTDGISSLPEELLLDILLFLPTKDAVATSVLSKRWRHVFTRLTRLDLVYSPIHHGPRRLDRYPYDSFSRFEVFVNNILHSSQSKCITSFKLHFGGDNIRKYPTDYYCRTRNFPYLNPLTLNAWICFPLALGVRELDLLANVHTPSKLPPALFGCQTLEVLKIKSNLHLELPATVHFPNLKVLHLSLKAFTDVDAISKLVSSCQSLEDLAMRAFSWGHTDPINISAPHLRRLCIAVSCDCASRCAFVLDTPNLEYLDYADDLALQYSLGVLNALTAARLCISFSSFEDSDPNSAHCLLRSLSHVERLYLKGFLEYLTFFELRKLPPFPSLKHLKLAFDGYHPWHGPFMEQLYSSPMLETIVIKALTTENFIQDIDHHRYGEVAEDESRYWGTIDETVPIPACLCFHLRRIVIEKYWGIEWELQLVKYFLTNALVLEKLVIICESSMATANRASLESILQKLPKSSGTCSIQVQ